MNASTIISDDMTLEEKLASIDQAILNAQVEALNKSFLSGIPFVPIDPADLTSCEGCQQAYN